MFRTFGPAVAAALEGTKIVEPDEVYDGRPLHDRSRRPQRRNAHLGPGAHARRPGGLAARRAHPVHGRPGRGTDVPDLSRGSRPTMSTSTRRIGRTCSPTLEQRKPAHRGSRPRRVGGAEILAAVRDYIGRSRPARRRAAQGGEGCRRDRRGARSRDPRRTSRLARRNGSTSPSAISRQKVERDASCRCTRP